MSIESWIRTAVLLVCALLASMGSQAAHPSHAPSWEVAVYGGAATAADLTAAQLAAKPTADFAPFTPRTTYATSAQQHVWLRLRVGTSQALPAQAWQVSLPKAFIDTVVLHYRDSQGLWAQQAAGDWVAHQRWPVRSTTPQFYLPAQPAGSQDYFLQVRNRTPLNFDVQLQSAGQAQIQSQNSFFWVGLAIGLMLLLAMASGVLAAIYWRGVYAWYSVYVLVNVFLSLAYAGLGSYALWPNATRWPEISITLLYMLGVMVQLQFCRVMFLAPATAPVGLQRATALALGLGGLSVALNFYALERFGSSLVFTLHVLGFNALSLGLMVRQFQRTQVASWLYLLASLPLTFIGWLAVLEHAGWVALHWLPYNAPIYAFAFEMPVLFAAMYLHSMAEHAKTVRQTTLAHTDPTTGFVHAHLHMATLTQAWELAQDQHSDTVVVYVQVVHQLGHQTTLGGPRRTQSVERAVRLLRTVAREQDNVTHVGPDVFAMLMPGTALDSTLANRLARLVALAVMTDQDAARDVPLRFRMVASSISSFDGSAEKLHAVLQWKLTRPDWGQRAIRYVRNRSAVGKQIKSSRPEETLSQFWDRALDDEAHPKTQPAQATQ